MHVWDCSGRPLLFPLNKGFVEQSYPYTLTNHIWNFDQELINHNARDIRALMAKGGMPPGSLDTGGSVENAPNPGRHRFGILAGLGIISALFAWLLLQQWRASRI